MSHNTFGECLRSHRERRDLTRDQLASAVNCSAELIRKIERSQRRPSKLTADLLATHFELVGSEREAFLQSARIPLGTPQDTAQSSRTQLSNVPHSVTPLIGRTHLLAELRSLLCKGQNRLITLMGAPGIGKTRMALAAAAALTDQFRDGVCFVSLASLNDPMLVAHTIALALGLQTGGGPSITDILKSHLRQKHLLLVLDNFEHLLPAAPLVSDLLTAAPSLTALATSREALQIYGEQEYQVPPLTLPRPNHAESTETLEQYEAVMLFVQRAQAIKSNFVLNEETAPLVAKICIQLEGLPLALELAAARIKLFSLSDLLAGMDSRMSFLKTTTRDLPPRQQTLRNAIDWSYNLLDEEEKWFFERLCRGYNSACCGGHLRQLIAERG